MTTMTNQPATEYTHGPSAKIGIIISNLGSPDAPTSSAVRRYLRQFLSDSRVIEIPKIAWLPILYGPILTFRPPKVAKNYASIWQEGRPAPLVDMTLALSDAVSHELNGNNDGIEYVVETAMRYGSPSIASAMTSLKEAHCDHIFVLPLYPQYSASTTASTNDEVFRQLQKWRWQPNLLTLNHYHDSPAYIEQLKLSIESFWASNGRGEKLLMSFHGLPKRNLTLGDPYFCHCHKTARLLAEALALEASEWQLCFQSRFGPAEWLQPYALDVIDSMADAGHKQLDIVCPGFPIDCLETLDEIAVEANEHFIEQGGESLRYIPSLNTSSGHVTMLSDMVSTHTQVWATQLQATTNSANNQTQALAKVAGAKQ